MRIITTVYRHADLLPHFLEFYQSQGIREFLIGVHDQPHTETWRQVQAYTRGVPARTLTSPYAEFAAEHDVALKNHLKDTFVSGDEWGAVADLDEFHEYPEPLAELLEKADQEGADCVIGHFLDRLADDGSLATLTEGLLWDQYPIGADLTANVLQAATQKVMLFKGRKPLGSGHHYVENGVAYSKTGTVHHFKWNSFTIERLAELYDLQTRQGKPWTVETRRFFDYWSEHQRIDLEDPCLNARRVA